jgi:membrane protein
MDLLDSIGACIARIEQRLFERPIGPVIKPLSPLVIVLRYAFALLRDLAAGHLTLRAMSLVYTTLLSIVPLIALSFSVLKGLGYHRYLEPVLYQFLQPLGDRASELTARVMQFVENVQSGVLGSLGLAFLLYTVISMIQKVEESFNFVWRVGQPRSLGRRFSEYLSVMVIGPVIMVAAMGLLTIVGSNRLVQLVTHNELIGTALLQLGRLTPYALVVGVFTFMYAFIPNTKVGFRAAAIGGTIAGILWAATGELFTTIVVHSARTMAIYASFAILIVALMWLHLSWLILMVGAQLAFYVQHPQFLRPGQAEIRLTSTLRERLALSIMYLVGQDFRTTGATWDLQRLADMLDVPGTALGPVVHCLERRGLLVTTEEDKLLPGRDLPNIDLADVMDAVRNDTEGPRMPQGRSVEPAEALAREADTALKESLRGKTLKDLVGGNES